MRYRSNNEISFLPCHTYGMTPHILPLIVLQCSSASREPTFSATVAFLCWRHHKHLWCFSNKTTHRLAVTCSVSCSVWYYEQLLKHIGVTALQVLSRARGTANTFPYSISCHRFTSSSSMAFVAVYASALSLALWLHGSTAIVGFTSLTGRYIGPCFSFIGFTMIKGSASSNHNANSATNDDNDDGSTVADDDTELGVVVGRNVTSISTCKNAVDVA
mmetsp:Transcript_40026/g.60095  ORF Transcript_40026/g.60095 Transcript_40026/m.60095 type:complete len:217 (-) Transcript_40026:185-835(-)